MSLHEAVAWIMTGDEIFARQVAEGGRRFSIALAIREQGGRPPIRKRARATNLLWSRCASGRVLAKGFRREPDPSFPKTGNYWTFSAMRERIDPADWTDLTIEVGDDARPKKGDRPFYRAPVFRRKDVIDALSVTVSDGAPPVAGATSIQPTAAQPKARNGKGSNIEQALRVTFGNGLGRAERDWQKALNGLATWAKENPTAALPKEDNWRRNIDRIWKL